MTPVIISSTGTIDPSQFINVVEVGKEGKKRILGFTAKGVVYEFKMQKNGEHDFEAWNCIASGPWIR